MKFPISNKKRNETTGVHRLRTREALDGYEARFVKSNTSDVNVFTIRAALPYDVLRLTYVTILSI